MFRLNGNIIEQLEDVYHNYSFNKKYKSEIKNRVLTFFNLKVEENKNNLSWNEFKIFLNQNVIFKKDIEKISFLFFDKYKEELFNLFNPIWFNKRREFRKNKEEQIFNIKIINLFIQEFPTIFIRSFYFNFYVVSKLNKRFHFFDRFNRMIPKLRKTKEIKEALNFNKKLDFDKTDYLNKIEEYKSILLVSLYLDKVDNIVFSVTNNEKVKISNFNLVSSCLFMNNSVNIEPSFVIDFFNKELIFKEKKFELDDTNKSYILYKDVFDKIENLKEKIIAI